LLLAAAAASGCGVEDRGAPVARNQVRVPAAEVERAMGPLSVAPDAHPAPDTAMAPADNVSLDARLLVITANGSSSAFAAITSSLQYLGTPFDPLNASTGAPLTTDVLATGDHGHYYGVILDSGDLAVGSASGFNDDEWMALARYEARFGVRRAVLYASPSAAYGLQLTAGSDASTAPIAAQCTSAGTAVFVGANCAVPVSIAQGWAYGSQPADAFTLPLLADAAGNVYAATRTYPDGREALVLTFAQSPTALHTLELAYGIVNWVTRGLFIGERHVYAVPQIDDFYLASAIYTGGTYRITAADLQSFTAWQSARQGDALTSDFRAAFAFNALRAQPAGQDPLSDLAQALGPTFGWVNHTWDHRDMTALSYVDAFQEFSQNDQFGRGTALARYNTENLVTPGVSGLDNAEVMRAAYDVGVRQLVSDTSQPGQNNPSPNAGYRNAQMTGLLVMPRHPTDLYFNVSQPTEWIAEYQALHGAAVTYDQIIATISDSLARYMLRGDNDSWMFHQANLRDLGGGHSLLSDLLDAAFAKYAARATFPLRSPDMDVLADKVAVRMELDASGVSATIEPGAKLTVRVTNKAWVPVTGLCTPSVETYAGQQISRLALDDGQSITVSLADCNAGLGGTGGTGGSGGGGGSPGGADGGAGNGWAGDDGGTRGSLSTDAGIDTVVPDAGGCGCSVPWSARGRDAAGGLLALALALAAFVGRRRRRR
jgi:hypothetical protein